MSFLSKFGVGAVREPLPRELRPSPARETRAAAPLHAPAISAGPSPTPRAGRYSNGLKEFLSQLDGIRRGTLLDMGPPWQDTLNFFIERGFKVYTEDILGSMSEFLREEETQSHLPRPETGAPDTSAGGRAECFLAANLRHAKDTFDAVLLWDSLDYLDRETATRVAAKIASMVRAGGAVLTVFNMRMPERLQRYRVLDALNLELVPAPPLVQPRHIYQNREIQDLFHGFRSSKFFVGRDQLREGVFIK